MTSCNWCFFLGFMNARVDPSPFTKQINFAVSVDGQSRRLVATFLTNFVIARFENDFRISISHYQASYKAHDRVVRITME